MRTFLKLSPAGFLGLRRFTAAWRRLSLLKRLHPSVVRVWAFKMGVENAFVKLMAGPLAL